MTPSTYLERRWPDSPVFQDIARHWCEDQSRLLLELVWRGYDRLLTQDLSVTAFSDTDEAKEESLNFLLCLQINHCMTGDEPCCAIHQPPEQTKRKRGRGRSPQPDIGFTLYDYPRAVWPMEGKILRHDHDVKPYIAEVECNFITRRYATFSSEGAMLGYLLQGEEPRAAPKSIHNVLSGMRWPVRRFSGGIAALNHRLMAGNPPGSQGLSPAFVPRTCSVRGPKAHRFPSPGRRPGLGKLCSVGAPWSRSPAAKRRTGQETGEGFAVFCRLCIV
jgi:hypothetical protein